MFGSNLQYYRKKIGLTQDEFADTLNVSRQTVSKWEQGDSYPEMDRLLKICDLLKCDLNAIMREDCSIIDNLEIDNNTDISSSNIENMIKKTKIDMIDKEFNKAMETLEKISDIDIECAEMWWLRFLSSNCIINDEQLMKMNVDFRYDDYFITAIKCSKNNEIKDNYKKVVNTAYENLQLSIARAEEKDKLRLQALEISQRVEQQRIVLENEKLEVEKIKKNIAIKKKRNDDLLKVKAYIEKYKKQLIVLVTCMLLAISGTVTGVVLYQNSVTYDVFKIRTVGEEVYITDVQDKHIDITSATIPSEIRGKQVVGIDENALAGLSNLESITLPNTLVSIGSGAFEGCGSLSSITLPKSIVTMGASVFSGCNNLTIHTEVLEVDKSEGWDSNWNQNGDNNNVVVWINAVDIPVVIVSNSFTGAEQSAEIQSSDVYTISNNIQTNAGVYTATLTLNDTSKYAWKGGSQEPIFIEWTIVKKEIDKPNIIGRYIFNGKDQFANIAESNWYTINNGTLQNAGNHIVSVDLVDTDNCKWSDNSILTHEINWTIEKLVLDKPTITGNYIYNGKDQLVNIAESNWYSVQDGTRKYMGNYIVSVELHDTDNCKWSDDGDASFKLNWTINQLVVSKPIATTDFVYNNGKKYYATPLSEWYSASGNEATAINDYTATITLNDNVNSRWDDDGDAEYSFDWSIVPLDEGLRFVKAGDYYRVNDYFGNAEKVVIPTEYEGLPVTVINNYAFFVREIKEVVIPNSIIVIGYSAFASCERLTEVIIPDSVTTIHDEAFEQCYGLTRVVIPSSVTSLGDRVFDDCTSLTIYAEAVSKPTGWGDILSNLSVPVIWDCDNNDKDEQGYEYMVFDGINYKLKDGNAAVYGSHKSTEVIIIPEEVNYKDIVYTVTEIIYKAFYENNKVRDIIIPTTIKTVNSSAFWNAECNLLFRGEKTSELEYQVRNLDQSKIFWGVGEGDYIQSGDFVYIISEGTATLSYYNGAPQDIIIPDKVPNTNISVTALGDYAFANSNVTSVVLPTGLTKISNYAFANCNKLRKIIIPENVTSIGTGAFKGCSALISVQMADNVISIGDSAFEGCSAFETIKISAGLQRIGNRAFSYCRSLKSLTIPNSVTDIGGYAFAYCGRQLIVNMQRKYDGGSTFDEDWDYSGTTTTHQKVPVDTLWNVKAHIFIDDLEYTLYNDDILTLYKYTGSASTVELSSIIKYNEINYQLVNIGNSAFRGCKSITNITIPNGVTNIHTNAFSGCSSLESIIIPDGVISIGNAAFSECVSMDSIIIPASVKKLGSSMIYGSGITQIYMRHSSFDGVELGSDWNSISSSLDIYPRLDYIGEVGKDGFIFILRSDNTFNIVGYTGTAASIEIPEYVLYNGANYPVTTIASYAFRECNSLETVIIPASVVEIQSNVFYKCYNLTNIYMRSVRGVGMSLGSYWNDVNKYGPGGVVKPIWNYKEFYTVDDFEYLLGNDNTASIVKYTGGLDKLVIPSSVNHNGDLYLITNIFSFAFDGASSLTSVIIPDTIKSIGASAFNGCNSLINIYMNSASNSDMILGESWNDINGSVDGGEITLTWNYKFHYGSNEFSYICFNDGTAIIIECNGSATSLEIPSVFSTGGESYAVFNIADNAFKDYNCLERVIIPAGIKSIGVNVFCNKENLTIYADSTVVIDSSYKALIFEKVTNGQESYSLISSRNTAKLIDVVLPNEIGGIPVRSISTGVFDGSINMSSIVIPNTVTMVAANMFKDCINADFKIYLQADTLPIIDELGFQSNWNSSKPIYLYSASQPSTSTPDGAMGYWAYEADGVTIKIW